MLDEEEEELYCVARSRGK